MITSVARSSKLDKVVSGGPRYPNGYINFNAQPSASCNLVQNTAGI